MHFQHESASILEHRNGIRRTKRNVFYDMLEDFTGDDDDDDDEDESNEKDAASESESVESTTRFGRFMSPLAFSKISETLGFYFILNLQLCRFNPILQCERGNDRYGKLIFSMLIIVGDFLKDLNCIELT